MSRTFKYYFQLDFSFAIGEIFFKNTQYFVFKNNKQNNVLILYSTDKLFYLQHTVYYKNLDSQPQLLFKNLFYFKQCCFKPFIHKNMFCGIK